MIFPLIVFLLLTLMAGGIYVLLRNALLSEEASNAVRISFVMICSLFLSPGLAIGHGVMLFPAGLVTILSILSNKPDILNSVLWGTVILVFSALEYHFGTKLE